MLDLPAILKQAEAATDGPWEHGSGPYGWDDGIIVAGQSPSFAEGVVITNSGHGGTSPSDADAEFIAACRTNVPMLVAALEEAQGKLAAVDKELHTVSCLNKKTCEHAVCGLARRLARILLGEK